MGVWVSDDDGGDMLEHHRVVSAIFERVDCLPVRFPTRAEDPVSLLRPEHRPALLRVRGKAEFAITRVWDTPLRRERAGNGRDFMEKRRAYWAERRRVEEWARTLPPNAVVKLAPNDRIAASVALLLPRGAAPSLPDLPGTRSVINGPWPPYSFATI